MGDGRRRAAALILAACAWPAAAAPVSYTLDPDHTQPAFEISHLGLSTYRGKFTSVRGKVLLDAEAGSGSLHVVIDADSLLTGSRVLDQVLKGEDFFAVERHPALIYKSSRVAFEDGRPVRVEGELTLAGVTRPVVLHIHSFRCTTHPLFRWRQVCGADASATLRRSEFGLTRYDNLLGDEVKLLIPVEATRD